jgi:hypothetical protein
MRRWSFLLAALLGLAVFVESARLVERLVRVRVDLSEDQLLSPSPATRELLGSLEDVAQVTLYASGESDSAPFQLARRRVNEELAELAGLARGRMRLVQVDPSRSSTAALEAAEYGIEARSIATVESSSLTSEIVFLGGVLRYRGREHVFPTFLPGAVEYQLVTALASLVRDARPRLGWFAPGRAPERFRTARDLLSRRGGARARRAGRGRRPGPRGPAPARGLRARPAPAAGRCPVARARPLLRRGRGD